MSIARIQTVYTNQLTRFLDSWGKIIDKKSIIAIENMYKWVKEYPQEIMDRTAPQKIQYFKRGVNLLDKMVNTLEEEKSRISLAEMECRQDIIKGNKRCTEAQRKKYGNLLVDYNYLLRDLIGCQDRGTDLLLTLLNVFRKQYGDSEYEKKLNDFSVVCLELGQQRIKRF